MHGYRCLCFCASGRLVSKLIWSERGNKFWILELRNEDHFSECKKAVRNRFCVKHNFSFEFLREYYYSTTKMYIGGSKVRSICMCLEDNGNDTEEMLLLFRTEHFKYRKFRVGLNFLCGSFSTWDLL